jgi:hypothetical protein
MKAFIKGIPMPGSFLVYFRTRSDDFKNSSYYWDQRYRTGGNSGAGSYGRLAEFKACFMNAFLDQHQNQFAQEGDI